MKLLLTGATGFIGRHLLRRLAASGHQVLALARAGPAEEQHVTWHPWGEDAAQAVALLARRHRPDALVHAAGRFMGSAAELAAANEHLTGAVVAGLETAQPDAHLVHISSISAAGVVGAYGRSKRAAERIIERSKLARWTILRSERVYGPGHGGLVDLLVSAVRAWPVVPVAGASAVRLQPVHVDDLGACIEGALSNRQGHRCLYTIAGPRPQSVRELIDDIGAALGRRPPLVPIPLAPVRLALRMLNALCPWLNLPVEQLSLLASPPAWDIGPAQRDLGFRPRSFAEGIAEMLGGPAGRGVAAPPTSRAA